MRLPQWITMINNKYINLPKELENECQAIFGEAQEAESLKFLDKYRRFIESDESCYNRLFLTEDPMKDRREKKSNMFQFNFKVYSYLEKQLENDEKMGKKSHCQGDVACFIGVAYEYGLFGIKKNSEMAYNHFRIAAQLKSALGTFKLGQCYERGFGTLKNPERAVYFFRCSAKLGLLDGMHVYGTILANGLFGCEPNPRLGLHFLSMAAIKANHEYPFALYDMAAWYEDKNREHIIVPDPKYAFQLYLRGSELGEPNCQYRIAQVYEKGEFGENIDSSKAVSMLRKASLGGQIDAQLRLSYLLYTGIPGKVNQAPKESYLWAVKAATKKNGRGAYVAGEYVLKGFGTKKDILFSWWWFIISERLGYPEAPAKAAELRRIIFKLDEGHYKKKCCGIFCFDIC